MGNQRSQNGQLRGGSGSQRHLRWRHRPTAHTTSRMRGANHAAVCRRAYVSRGSPHLDRRERNSRLLQRRRCQREARRHVAPFVRQRRSAQDVLHLRRPVSRRDTRGRARFQSPDRQHHAGERPRPVLLHAEERLGAARRTSAWRDARRLVSDWPAIAGGREVSNLRPLQCSETPIVAYRVVPSRFDALQYRSERANVLLDFRQSV